jgi:Holliday junction resolvase RusA-like endonuclease
MSGVAKEFVVSVVIEGNPISKQRPRLTKLRNGRVYTPKGTKAAQDAIAWAVRAARCDLHPSEGDFAVEVRFFTKTRQRRDLDNMVKLVMDACNHLVWIDDAQVTSIVASVERSAPRPRTELSIWVRPDSIPRVACEMCGQLARVYDSTSDRRFCSRACSNEAMRIGLRVRCASCNAEIYRAIHRLAKSFVFFCSQKCKHVYETVELRCAQCSTVFRKPRSLMRHGHPFCGKPCQWAYWKAHRAKTRGTCDVCGGATSDKRRKTCRPCHANRTRDTHGSQIKDIDPLAG